MVLCNAVYSVIAISGMAQSKPDIWKERSRRLYHKLPPKKMLVMCARRHMKMTLDEP
jgi:hypothetical protein